MPPFLGLFCCPSSQPAGAYFYRRLLSVLRMSSGTTLAVGASKLWSDFGNWSPDGSPASDDVFVGVGPGGGIVAAAADDVTLVDQNFTIDSLTIGNGADVDTQGNELIVAALTLIEDTGSRITVRPRSSATAEGLDIEGITINNGATVSVVGEMGSTAGGVIELESGLFEINAGARRGGPRHNRAGQQRHRRAGDG